MSLQTETAVERPVGQPPAVDAKPDWAVALRRAVGKFGLDQCTDVAATLTYYALFSLFPALAALVSLIGLTDISPQEIVNVVAEATGRSANDPSLATLRDTVERFSSTKGAGLAFVVGLLTALWSASGYVNAFSRAMNRIYDVGEGRPFLKLRPWLYLVTAVLALLIFLVLVALALSGGLADAIGSQIGLGEQAVTVWKVAKWPFLIAIVVVIIGMLYWATPNVRKPRRMFFSWGALVAFVIWALATVGFAVYVAVSAGASYQKTFGPFAGAVLFLFWLWLTNLALLFGAELDAELERTRQLRSGLPAEEMILLPARDESGIEKLADTYDRTVLKAQALRLEADADAEEVGRPYTPGDLRRRSDERVAGAMAASTQAPDRPGTRHEPAGSPRRAMIDSDGVARGSVAGVGEDDDSAVRPEHGPGRRGPGSPLSSTPIDEEVPVEIQERRTARRDEALARAEQARDRRDRMREQEKKAEQARRRAQKRAQAAAKAREPHEPPQERWARVEQVRARFAPAPTAARDEVAARRAERRARFDARKAQEAVAERSGAHESAATLAPSAPSAARVEVERARRERREAWFAGVPAREPEEVPIPRRRDLRED